MKRIYFNWIKRSEQVDYKQYGIWFIDLFRFSIYQKQLTNEKEIYMGKWYK